MIIKEASEVTLKHSAEEQKAKKGILVLIKRLYEQHYLDRIFKNIDGFGEVFSEIRTSGQQYQSISNPTKKDSLEINIALLKIVEQLNHKPEKSTYDEKYPDLVTLLNQTILMQPESILEQQSIKRFNTTDGDSVFLKLVKLCKRFLFLFSTSPTRLINLFRKEKKILPYWSHAIPFQGLLNMHFNSNLIKKLELLSALYSKGICSALVAIKSWEEHTINNPLSDPSTSLAFPECDQAMEHLKESLKSSFDTIFNSAINEFDIDYQLVGTVELSGKKFSKETLIKKAIKNRSLWSSHHLKWQNTLFAFTEEWRSDLQLFVLANHSLQQINDFDRLQEDRINQNIIPLVQEIRALIELGKTEVDELTENAAGALSKINYQLSKKLDGVLMPKLNESILGLNIPNLIDRIQDSIEKSVEKYSGTRVIVKDEAFDKPMKTEDLKWISSFEFISFESLQDLLRDFRLTKSSALNATNETFVAFEDLDHIVSFSFNSAVTALKEEECTHDEALATAKEGLVRIENRLLDLENEIAMITAKTQEELQVSLKKFADGLMALSINENLTDLQLRIATAKASRQASQVSMKLFEQLKRGALWVIGIIKIGASQAFSLVNQWRSKYMLVAPKKEMSRDVSNFLLESQQSIEKLPLVYRRLFKIEALRDQEFFVGREKELESVTEAFNNWSVGRYAATAIQGEQWSGLTSFINTLISKVKFNLQITRISPSNNIYRREELVSLLKQNLETPGLKDIGEIEKYLNESHKRVIFIEDLQNLFLRSVDGFALLKSLFELINNTQKQVFWVVTVNIYAWEYLAKTIQIKDYFSYQISLQEFGEEQIIDIILRRNRISGFSIDFIADESKLLEKKFARMDKLQQQEWLRSEFFSSMNSFAKSNVSMALLFWLMSTKEVDQNTITINTFKKPDLSFLNTLSQDKIFVLQTLILHDGLNLEQLGTSVNIAPLQANMLLMALLEDGILFKKKEVYLVNPIVYRAVVNLLKSKNLIH